MPSSFVSPIAAQTVNLFTPQDLSAQRAFFASRPDLHATPLHKCQALARHLGIGELLVKDETARFGLNAFKGVGTQFAVATLLARGEIRRGDTLVCASEGNHGRAVAHAAREVQCPARVYMSQSVAPPRVQAIESEGATVVLVAGSYDDAVRQMARDAEAHGWVVISDTSWPGYSEIPRLIMLGYTRILDEIDVVPDVVFVQAGVGGLLAAVACYYALPRPVPGLGGQAPGSGPVPLIPLPPTASLARHPKVVAGEPVSAACVQASARAGRPTSVPGPFTTSMGGLRCGEMSPAVFPAVASLVDAFLGIEDAFAFEAMRLLARPVPPDPVVECGPSGAAALGGLLATVADPALASVRERLSLGPETRVLVIVTEGVTDPALFQATLARP